MGSIRENVSILEVYNKLLGTNYSLDYVKKNNIKCPFHEDAKASARIYLDTNTLYCFSCCKHWSPVPFIQEHSKCTVSEAKRLACSIGGVPYKEEPVDEDAKLYYEVYNYCAGLFSYIYEDTYFQSRGLSKEIIKEYKLGYCPTVFNTKLSDKPMSLKDILIYKYPDVPVEKLDELQLYDFKGTSRYADRYIFPIKDSENRVVGFTARAKGDAEPKYYNTPGTAKYFKKSLLLYNYDVAIQYPFVYVVEGTFDALSLIQNGIKNVVAPLGTSFTQEHINMLAGRNIILALDNDKAGLNTMYKHILNNPLIHFNIFLLEGYKDFNEALVNGYDFKKVSAKNTLSSIEFILYSWKKGYDLSILSNRVQLCKIIETILPLGKYHWLEVDYYTKILKRLLKGKE